MKYIGKNVCYIQLRDLEFLRVIPLNIFNQIEWGNFCNEKLQIIRFAGEDSIEFFKKLDFIIDLSYYSKLTIEELEMEAQKIVEELASISTEWLSSSTEKRKEINERIEYGAYTKKLRYKLEALNNYIQNKDKIDNEFKNLNMDFSIYDMIEQDVNREKIMIPINCIINEEIIKINKTRKRTQNDQRN